MILCFLLVYFNKVIYYLILLKYINLYFVILELGEIMKRKEKVDNLGVASSGSKKKSSSRSRYKVEVTPINFSKTKKRIYFGYRFKVIIFCFLFACFFISSMKILVNSLQFEDREVINYNEKSVLDYSVKLKENDYYDSDTLGKNMVYVASLIDSIDTYFNYNFDIDSNIDMNFTYSIVGKLLITDEDGKNVYLEKDYPILDSKKVSMTDSTHYSINEKVSIDYDYYNSIASGFKASYGVNSNSSFIVTMKVVKESLNSLVKVNNNVSTQSINIPLTLRSVNIELNYNDINNESSVISENDVYVDNLIGIIVSLVLLVFSIIFMIKFMRYVGMSITKKNKYDKYVNKLLREYDRLIVESYTIIDFNNYEVIKVNKFEELLDVRDNLKLPINYYVVTPHQKAYFYIISTNIYLYTVKAVDLENN